MSEIKYIRLSDLSRKIENTIRDNFGSESYWIVAEISGHKFYPERDRHYFDFVEKIENSSVEAAKISGKAWSNSSSNIRYFEAQTGQKFTNGIQVLAKVKVEYHVTFGLSLILQDLDLSFTLGNIERQRQEILQRLLTENPDHISLLQGQYITRNKKLQMCKVVQNIALVASPNSEGYTDFMHTLSNNNFQYKFNIETYFSSVQGANAVDELTKTFLLIFKSNKPYDAVILIRGGGAKTDFMVFDTYDLARIVARFPIPVITGIGHHKDISICDIMCHSSTKTPTQAAEFIISHNRAFEDLVTQSMNQVIVKSQQLLRGQFNLTNALYFNISNNAVRLLRENKDVLSRSYRVVTQNSLKILQSRNQSILSQMGRITTKPLIQVKHAQSNLENMVSNLQSFSKKLMENQRSYLGHFKSVINLMSPKSIMKRGFAIVSMDNKIMRDAAEIPEGANIKVHFSEHELESTVISKTKTDGKNFDI